MLFLRQDSSSLSHFITLVSSRLILPSLKWYLEWVEAIQPDFYNIWFSWWKDNLTTKISFQILDKLWEY